MYELESVTDRLPVPYEHGGTDVSEIFGNGTHDAVTAEDTGVEDIDDNSSDNLPVLAESRLPEPVGHAVVSREVEAITEQVPALYAQETLPDIGRDLAVRTGGLSVVERPSLVRVHYDGQGRAVLSGADGAGYTTFDQVSASQRYEAAASRQWSAAAASEGAYRHAEGAPPPERDSADSRLALGAMLLSMVFESLFAGNDDDPEAKAQMAAAVLNGEGLKAVQPEQVAKVLRERQRAFREPQGEPQEVRQPEVETENILEGQLLPASSWEGDGYTPLTARPEFPALGAQTESLGSKLWTPDTHVLDNFSPLALEQGPSLTWPTAWPDSFQLGDGFMELIYNRR